jgi:hypothetical protein
MTTTTIRAFVREPFDLALGQPHQMLISAASVAIVASEAVSIVPWPYNIALAIGAEWAYLRGLISGAGVKTPWAARLNWAAFLLVVLYGALAGFRGFHLIPATPSPFVAVLLTVIHIGAISAVTLCSAMLHRAGEDAKAVQRAIEETKEKDRAAAERAYQDGMKRQRDAQQLEMARKEHELALYEKAEAAKAAREIERERQRAELKMQSAHARTKMRRDAHSERGNAEPQICPKCSAELDRPQWLAARRWGHCSNCKEG